MHEWNNETAEWYASRYGEYATNQLAVDALELAPSSVVVDVGCGTGSALRHAAFKTTSGKLIGVDPIPRMIEIARDRVASHPARTRIEFRKGPAEELPVDDDFADVVFAFDSFDHWQAKARGLAEIRRVLRQNGQLVVVKDGGLPGGATAGKAFVNDLASAGFHASAERRIKVGDVSFTMWICSVIG